MAIICENGLFGVDSATLLPPVISGSTLFAWFAPTTLATPTTYQTTNTSTAAVADGDPVGNWLDLSGNNYSLIQATSGNRPTLKLNQQNGYPSIRFNGTTTSLARASALTTTYSAITVVAAFKSTTFTTVGTWIDAQSSSSAGRYVIRSGQTSGYWSWSSGSFVTGSAGTANSWAVLNATFNGASSAFHLNGGTDSTGNIGTANSPFGSNGILLGQGGSGGNWCSGDMLEICYYSGALSNANRTLVDNYFRTKYGIW